MRKLDEHTISLENENWVRDWFELSGFSSAKLDTPDGKAGKSADWKFAKQQATIVCEVKTIFSGGQAWETQDQYERRIQEAKRKLDFDIKNLPEGTRLITHKDYLDFVQGKVPYQAPRPRKEKEFHDFLKDVRSQLKADAQTNQMPFHMSISIDAMYVAYGDIRKQFVEWLKGFVQWADQHHNHEHIHSSATFPFDKRRAGTNERAIEAFVQVMGPFPGTQLEVGFLEGGGQYNELGIANLIHNAIAQLRASVAKESPSVLPVIALWSESRYLYFSTLLYMDAVREQLNEIPTRYYLFDWAFSEYPQLAAIILFELRSNEKVDFWQPVSLEKLSPFGFVITNPFVPEAEASLKSAIIEKCAFIRGISFDPLA